MGQKIAAKTLERGILKSLFTQPSLACKTLGRKNRTTNVPPLQNNQTRDKSEGHGEIGNDRGQTRAKMRQGGGVSAPNHKSQIASDLKSRSPNRKNFPQIAASGSSSRTFKSRDLWFEPLFKSLLESQCQFLIQQVRTMSFLRTFTVSQID